MTTENVMEEKVRYMVKYCTSIPECIVGGKCKNECLYSILMMLVEKPLNLTLKEFEDILNKCAEEGGGVCRASTLASMLLPYAKNVTIVEVEAPKSDIEHMAELLGLDPKEATKPEFCSKNRRCEPDKTSLEDVRAMIFCEALRLMQQGEPRYNAEREAVNRIGLICGTATVIEAIVSAYK